jgi:tetratricopeptide (TPR) repeat protein
MIMDILSTGQKIKRARIYKGITLKELCGDKISISKMSCIENGKIKADDETIKYISKIIDVEYKYLLEDVYDQIMLNLKDIKEKTYNRDEYEEKINENLSYAFEYEYFQVAFDLIHTMINFYIKEEEYASIEAIIPKYYLVYQKTVSDTNTITYLLDMAKYFYSRKKYNDAIAYYSRLKELDIITINKEEIYLNIQYYEARCYYELKSYGKAYELIKRIIEVPNLNKEDLNYFGVLNLYALVCIRFGYIEAEKYIIECNKYISKYPKEFAIGKMRYAIAYFAIGDNDKGIEEIMQAISKFPSDNKNIYVEFINNCIEILNEYKEFEKSHELAESNLNLAIETQNIKLIEKSYFLKGRILENLDRLNEAEIYMNLSLDSLMKFGSKEERLNRYTDMGNLYYKLGNIRDSIRYFNFVVNLDKLI